MIGGGAEVGVRGEVKERGGVGLGCSEGAGECEGGEGELPSMTITPQAAALPFASTTAWAMSARHRSPR